MPLEFVSQRVKIYQCSYILLFMDGHIYVQWGWGSSLGVDIAHTYRKAVDTWTSSMGPLHNVQRAAIEP